MNHQDADLGRRPWWPLALVAAGALAAAVAIGTGALWPEESTDSAPSAEESAVQRCRSDVLARLVAPDRASISELKSEASSLDTEGRDFSSLNAAEPLTGIDTSRITVLNVSGLANAPSEVGTTISDHFDCRAYFVDGTLAHTLVVFDHGH